MALNPTIRASNIRSKVQMIALLSHCDVELPHGQGTQQIRCLFHEDRRPSARIYTDTQKLYCYTCAKVWDVIAVAMKLKNLSYGEALDWLEREFNLPLPSDNLTEVVRGTLNSAESLALRGSALSSLRDMVEQRLIASRHNLGLENYCKMLLALDILWCEFMAGKRKIPEVQDFLQKILTLSDKASAAPVV